MLWILWTCSLKHTPAETVNRVSWWARTSNKGNFSYLLATAKSLQSYPTLCNPIDGSPLGSAVPGILQARTLEWVAISFSNAWKWKVKVKSLSLVQPSATPWTAAYQAPPSMGFSRQEYWSGVPLPSPSYLLHDIKNKKSKICVKTLVSFLIINCYSSNSNMFWFLTVNYACKFCCILNSRMC